MRSITFVSNFYSSYLASGTSERTRHLKNWFSKAGWNVKVVTTYQTLHGLPEPDEHDILLLSYSKLHLISLGRLFAFSQEIAKSDIVHIVDHWSLLNLLSVLLCKYHKVPYIFSPCGALRPMGRSLFLKRLYNFIFTYPLILPNAALLLAVTQDEANSFPANAHSIPTVLLPNGVWIRQPVEPLTLKSDHLLSQHGLNSHSFILFLGRLSYIKGPDLLANAYSSSPSLRHWPLVFAGPDDGMLQRISPPTHCLNPSHRLVFVGQVNTSERDILLRNALLTVIPSRSEAMSLVAVESSAVGTPVLATDQCGLDDFHEADACFICKANSDDIRVHLESILPNQRRLASVGSSAQDLVRSKYSWDSILPPFERLLISIISSWSVSTEVSL